MIFVLLVVIALAVLAPLLLVLRGRGTTRGVRALALDLHATQLRELDRDLAESRILPLEHKTAVLEVQRRMLAAAAVDEQTTRTGARWPILVTAMLVPIVAAGLYVVSGARPTLPSSDHSEVARQTEAAALIDLLRARLSQMEPDDDRTREGYLLLARAEQNRQNFTQAAADYRMALIGKFDPVIALNAAEASVQVDGGVTDSTADLYRKAIEAAPNAPWRPMAERRLAQPRLPPR